MWVVYKGSLWETDLGIRESLFPIVKTCNPNLEIEIKNEQGSRTVSISEVIDYSVYRNCAIK